MKATLEVYLIFTIPTYIFPKTIYVKQHTSAKTLKLKLIPVHHCPWSPWVPGSPGPAWRGTGSWCSCRVWVCCTPETRDSRSSWGGGAWPAEDWSYRPEVSKPQKIRTAQKGHIEETSSKFIIKIRASGSQFYNNWNATGRWWKCHKSPMRASQKLRCIKDKYDKVSI